MFSVRSAGPLGARCVFKAVQRFRGREVGGSGRFCSAGAQNIERSRRGMEDILHRTVTPLPSYETRDKSPPPPDSNSLEFMFFYRKLDQEQKLVFLEKLSREFGVDHRGVSELAVKLLETQQMRDLATVLQVEDRLRYSLTPRYRHLLGHISRVEGGVKFLVDLRADVLAITSSKVTDSPHMRVTTENALGEVPSQMGL